MTYYAKMIKDSVYYTGLPLAPCRLCTIEVQYPRFVHAQAKTHRIITLGDEQYELKQSIDLMDDPMLSRNSSSSRAVPVNRVLDRVYDDPVFPTYWGKNKPGMQSTEECTNPILINGTEYNREDAWKLASKNAASIAASFAEAGYHKEIVNRLTESFQWVKVIVTATEWNNFFSLRLGHAAQPEIQRLASLIKEAMDNSIPKELKSGEWHLPYVSDEEVINLGIEKAIACSVARVARISFNNHDGTVPLAERDISLHDMLRGERHLSPFEHPAKAMSNNVFQWERGVTHMDRDFNLWSGNLRGWIQYRQLV